MASLPVVGASEGIWGTELNAWLVVEHDSTGGHDSSTFMETLSSKLVMRNGNILTVSEELVFI